MKIIAVSDLHGETPKLPAGDLLIVAGDLTASDSKAGYERLLDWWSGLDFDCKLIVPGNHDVMLQRNEEVKRWLSPWVLVDQGIEYRGLKIWGSPWTFRFTNINPMCAAFTKRDCRDLKAKWDLIPADTDILVTHGPPHGILDESKHRERFGCLKLREAVDKLKPKLHIFGHIHEDGLKTHVENGTLFMNVSFLDADYEPRKECMQCDYEKNIYSSFTPSLINLGGES